MLSLAIEANRPLDTKLMHNATADAHGRIKLSHGHVRAQPKIAAGTGYRVRLFASLSAYGLIARITNGIVCFTWGSGAIWMGVRDPERLNGSSVTG